MPIGKNALKRVSNNGYSRVSSSAPDMENSVIEEAVEKTATPAPVQKKTAEKKIKDEPKVLAGEKKAPTPEKKSEKKRTAKAAEKPISKKAAESADVNSGRDGFQYINIGGEMPIHLL